MNAVEEHFFLDDYIQSLPTIAEAKKSNSPTEPCGFSLTKIVSNTTEVLVEISADDKDETKDIMKILGQKWNVATDDFAMFPLQQFPKDAAVYTKSHQNDSEEQTWKLHSALQKKLNSYYVMPGIRLPRTFHNSIKNPAS